MTGRDRIVVVVVAVAIVLAGAWFGLVAPSRHEAADLREQKAAAQTALDAAIAQVQAGEAARRTYAANKTLVAQLGKALPAADDSASLLYQLQDAAGRSKVAITAVTPGGSTTAAASTIAAPGGVQPVPISLSFEGSYADLERFLRRIHRFTSISSRRVAVRGQLVSVQSVDLKGSDVPGTPVSAVIQAVTYVGPAVAAVSPDPGSSAAVPPAANPSSPPTTTALIGAGG